jgi:hypothetical protein
LFISHSPLSFGLFKDLAGISDNVQAFTNPRWLKLLADPAQRSGRRVEDLASAGLSAESTTPKILPRTEGERPMRECGVI